MPEHSVSVPISTPAMAQRVPPTGSCGSARESTTTAWRAAPDGELRGFAANDSQSAASLIAKNGARRKSTPSRQTDLAISTRNSDVAIAA
jgi:hypothetical protein